MKYGTVPNTWLPGWEEVKPDQLLARGGRRVGRARFRVHGFKVNLSVPFKAMTDRLTTVRSPAEKLHLTDPVPMVWANHPLGAERPSDRPTGNSSVSVRLNGRRMSSRLEALRFPFYVVCDAHWNARFSSHLRTSFLNSCHTQNKLSLSRMRVCVRAFHRYSNVFSQASLSLLAAHLGLTQYDLITFASREREERVIVAAWHAFLPPLSLPGRSAIVKYLLGGHS